LSSGKAEGKVTDRDALLERLRRDAWRRGRIRLASGRESDFFIDCKQVILTGEGHRLGHASGHRFF
jgi:orotate phosphoribosyltransferase